MSKHSSKTTIFIIALLILTSALFSTACSTSEPVVTDIKQQPVKAVINLKGKCADKDEQKKGVSEVSHEQFGKGYKFDVPDAVGGNQTPASITCVKPDFWMLSGVTARSPLEPCLTIFNKWKEDGNKYKDDLVAIGGCRVVAMAPEPFLNFCGDQLGYAKSGQKTYSVGENSKIVGSFVDVEYDDGHTVTVCVGDTKGVGLDPQGIPNDAYFYEDLHWGHNYGSQVSLMEPWLNYEVYKKKTPGQSGFHDDLNGKIVSFTIYENRIQDIDLNKQSLSNSGSSGRSNSSNNTTTTATGSSSGTTSSTSSLSESDLIERHSSEWQHGSLPADKVKYIMMHDTESGTDNAENIINAWKGKGVAAHFMIDKNGQIFSCVPIDKIAHHAGWGNTNELFGITQERDDSTQQSDAPGKDYAMNGWSIGIEIVHDHGGGEYPEAQLQALDRLVSYIDSKVGHQPEIIDHKEWTGGPETSRAKQQGQGKQDCDDNFPLDSYKNTRTHDGSAQPTGEGEPEDEECADDDEDDGFVGEGAAGAVEWAKRVANSKTVGYGQDDPGNPSNNASREGVQHFDGKTNYNADCTSFVWYAWMVGGNNQKCREASANWGPATGGFDEPYTKAGFERHDLKDVNELKPGDVLWSTGHAALYIGNGQVAEASGNELGGITGGSPGDQQQTVAEGEEDMNGEVHINQIYGLFTAYWRYKG